MKWFLALIFFPALGFSAIIPLELFDQAKLETLLRNIPDSLIRIEEHSGFIKKHYQFPKSKSFFKITCQAIHFGNSKIPTEKNCNVEVNEKTREGDEIIIQLSSQVEVKALSSAISYGDEVKKFYSNELLYGQSRSGAYKNLFRFSVICKSSSCELSFSPKVTQE